MKLKRPKYTHVYTDQHGKLRSYLRRPPHKKVPLPGLPWSPEFMAAYEAALKGEWGKREIGAKRMVEGTVTAGLVSYYQTRAFTDLAPITQQDRRQVLEAFRADHGQRPLPIPADALQAIVDKKSPASQRHFKKAMRGFVDHCITKGWIKIDPVAGLKLSKMKAKGYHTWTVEEVEQYRQQHAPGTKPRRIGAAASDRPRACRRGAHGATARQRRQAVDATAEDRRAVRYPAAARAAGRDRAASDDRSACISRHEHRQAICRHQLRQLVSQAVQRGRSEALQRARPPQSRRRPPRTQRCNGTRIDGVVWLEDDQ